MWSEIGWIQLIHSVTSLRSPRFHSFTVRYTYSSFICFVTCFTFVTSTLLIQLHFVYTHSISLTFVSHYGSLSLVSLHYGRPFSFINFIIHSVHSSLLSTGQPMYDNTVIIFNHFHWINQLNGIWIDLMKWCDFIYASRIYCYGSRPPRPFHSIQLIYINFISLSFLSQLI